MRRLSLISKPSLKRSNLLLPPSLRLFLTLDPKPALVKKHYERVFQSEPGLAVTL